MVYLYIRRRRAIHPGLRAPDAVAARKDNRRRRPGCPGIPRGDDDRCPPTFALANCRRRYTQAKVSYSRRPPDGRFAGRQNMLFIPQYEPTAAVAQINRL